MTIDYWYKNIDGDCDNAVDLIVIRTKGVATRSDIHINTLDIMPSLHGTLSFNYAIIHHRQD